MLPFWLILGSVVILMGIFNKQMLLLLRLKPLSEVFTTPNIKHSSRMIEQIARWLVITIGVNFFVQGLGEAVPSNVSSKISLVLLGIAGLMLLVMFGIAIANWKAK